MAKKCAALKIFWTKKKTQNQMEWNGMRDTCLRLCILNFNRFQMVTQSECINCLPKRLFKFALFFFSIFNLMMRQEISHFKYKYLIFFSIHIHAPNSVIIECIPWIQTNFNLLAHVWELIYSTFFRQIDNASLRYF